MQKFTAHDAKAQFGNLIDTARREPVTIERHGRAVVVVLSKEEFDDIEAMKLERLRTEVQKGLEASARGDVIDIDENDLDAFIDGLMAGAAHILQPADNEVPTDAAGASRSGRDRPVHSETVGQRAGTQLWNCDHGASEMAVS
jgi:prevent-host-death family protein